MNKIFLTGYCQNIYEERVSSTGTKFKKVLFSFMSGKDDSRIITLTIYEKHFDLIKKNDNLIIEGRLTKWGEHPNEKTEISVFDIRKLEKSKDNKTLEKQELELRKLSDDFFNIK